MSDSSNDERRPSPDLGETQPVSASPAPAADRPAYPADPSLPDPAVDPTVDPTVDPAVDPVSTAEPRPDESLGVAAPGLRERAVGRVRGASRPLRWAAATLVALLLAPGIGAAGFAVGQGAASEDDGHRDGGPHGDAFAGVPGRR